MGNFSTCQQKARILMLGLDDVGKTTILYQLKFRQLVETISTIGFNTENVSYKRRAFEIHDFGGLEKIRWLFYRYCHDIHGLIFVIDTGDRQRLPEVKELLARLVEQEALRHVAVLIYANNRSSENTMGVQEIKRELNLEELLAGHKWIIKPVCAVSGKLDELFSGLDWLWKQISTTKDKISSDKR